MTFGKSLNLSELQFLPLKWGRGTTYLSRVVVWIEMRDVKHPAPESGSQLAVWLIIDVLMVEEGALLH